MSDANTAIEAIKKSLDTVPKTIPTQGPEKGILSSVSKDHTDIGRAVNSVDEPKQARPVAARRPSA